MLKKIFSIYVLSAFLMGTQVWAEISCPLFLGGKLSDAKNPSLLSQTVLTSHTKEERPTTRHLTSNEVLNLEITGNSQGHLIFKQSGQSPVLRSDQYLLGVWNLQDDSVGELYGIPESDKASEYVKHSSFNNNQPVLAAFRFKVNNDGFITYLFDHSGHYRPTPLNIYFVIKKLIQEGIDVRHLNVVFDFAISGINGLKISASKFIQMMDGLSDAEKLEFHNFENKKLNEDLFLEILYLTTDDPLTVAYLEIYYLRNTRTPQYDRLDSILDIVNANEIEEKKFYSVIKNIFGNTSKEISSRPLIDRSFGQKAEYYNKIISYLLTPGKIKNKVFETRLHTWIQENSFKLR